jgi:hypothetical protein
MTVEVGDVCRDFEVSLMEELERRGERLGDIGIDRVRFFELASYGHGLSDLGEYFCIEGDINELVSGDFGLRFAWRRGQFMYRHFIRTGQMAALRAGRDWVLKSLGQDVLKQDFGERLTVDGGRSNGAELIRSRISEMVGRPGGRVVDAEELKDVSSDD